MNAIAKIPQFGDADSNVLAIQLKLKEFGFSPGPIDGIFGGQTRSAVSKFQKKIGLAGSGIIGPKTIEALGLEIQSSGDSADMSELPSVKTKSPRTLPKALETLIDNAVVKNFPETFELLLKKKDLNGLMVVACEAMNLLEVREKTNKNDGYLVELVQKVSGGKRGWPWCMYAVECAVAWVELKTGVVSKFPSTGSCADARSRTPKSIQVAAKDSAPGDIWIWRYSSTGLGHTGVFSAWKKKQSVAVLYEGNTTKGLTKDGKIEREGGGYYRTERAFEISGMPLAMVVRAFG
jgi:hypothetical protein